MATGPGTGVDGASLPLVVMTDFLSEADLEQRVLHEVARVEAWSLHGNNAVPPQVRVLSTHLGAAEQWEDSCSTFLPRSCTNSLRLTLLLN